MNNKIFIECDCNSELLQLERDEEFNRIYICFYRYGRKTKYPWIKRLRHIWFIIKNGHPYSDEIILNKDEQEKLIKFLVGD